MTKARTLFIVSLVLNIFLLGTVAGGTYVWITKQREAVVAQQRGLRFAASELTQPRRQELRRALRRTRRDSVELVQASRQGRLDVARAMSARQFDRATLDAALARTRQADTAMRANIEAAVADFASTLTPEERERLVDAMQRRGPLRVGLPPSQQTRNAP